MKAVCIGSTFKESCRHLLNGIEDCRMIECDLVETDS
jgi:hypothetical protein